MDPKVKSLLDMIRDNQELISHFQGVLRYSSPADAYRRIINHVRWSRNLGNLGSFYV